MQYKQALCDREQKQLNMLLRLACVPKGRGLPVSLPLRDGFLFGYVVCYS